MNMTIWKYQCDKCSKWFKAVELPGEICYGIFLARNKKGSMRILYALEDPVYQEVSEIIETDEIAHCMDDMEKSDILQAAFEVACDNDDDGSPFQLNVFPTCPYCGSLKIKHYTSTEGFIEHDLESLTHEKWNTMTIAQRKEVVHVKLKELIQG